MLTPHFRSYGKNGRRREAITLFVIAKLSRLGVASIHIGWRPKSSHFGS